MLGDTQAIVDCGIPRFGIKARGRANILRRDADVVGDVFGRVLLVRGEGDPLPERSQVATFLDKVLVDQPFRDNHMGERIHHRHIGSRQQRKVVLGLHMRRTDEIDAPGIEDNQLGALSQAALHL